MDKIGVGVIGCGSIGVYHIDRFQKVPNVEVVAVCDTDKVNVKQVTGNGMPLDIFHESHLRLTGSLAEVEDRGVDFPCPEHQAELMSISTQQGLFLVLAIEHDRDSTSGPQSTSRPFPALVAGNHL